MRAIICRRTGFQIRLAGFFVSLAIAATTPWAIAGPPLSPNAITQPVGQNSALIPFDFNPLNGFKGTNVITDTTFSLWAGSALTTFNPVTKTTVPIVGGATFLFQQCYGGGFLDDLNNTLSNDNVPWVGGSAAQFNQPSYGQAKGVPAVGAGPDSPVGNPPVNYWTNQITPVLAPGANEANLINAANILDPVGQFSKAPAETGQLWYANGGDNITLDNNQAVKHYAILFAGLTDAQRHFTSISSIYSDLATAWAGTPYQITVLYGDGSHQVPFNNPEKNLALLPFIGLPNTTVLPATSNNLAAVFADDGADILKDYQNGITNDQFFFFGGDHGGNNKVAGGGVGGGGPVGTVTTTLPMYSITKDSIDQIKEDPITVPTITLDYTMTDPSSEVAVLFNGDNLGDLTSASTSVTLAIPDNDLLAGNNTIGLETLGGSAFTVNDYSVFTGAVDDGPVPEPVMASLLLTLFLPLALRRRTTQSPAV